MGVENLYRLFESHPHISTDSRNILPDSIFFALHGASFDGNDFAVGALYAGAAYSVIDRESVAADHPDLRDRLIVVEDTLAALQDLARQHRRALGIKILAITGSNGKTTTKELLSRVLGQRFNLYATRGNFNNHIGLPLTILAMDRATEFGVVEMGASSCGEIALLCSIAEPNYGLLTNVGRAHLEGFGGEEGVRRGKGELFDYLAQSGGTAFVAADSGVIVEMAAQRPTLRRIDYSYSLAGGVKHNLEGEYNIFNVAVAVAVGRAFDIPMEQIAQAVASYHPDNNRSQRVEGDHNTVIVDCYNANPSSMEVAIGNFAAESFLHREAKVMILGDMFELGEWSLAEHCRVVEQALSSDVEQIILVGENFGRAVQGSVASDHSRVIHFATRELLEQHLCSNPLTSRAILLKGSRGVGLEKILTLI